MADTSTTIPPTETEHINEEVVLTETTEEEDSMTKEEKVWIKLMEQNLEGVMFHAFEADLHCLLDLKGFKKMHEYQYADEMENLGHLKHKYIEHYKKLPILKSEGPDRWGEYAELDKSTITHEKISKLVKKSMENYASWETEVLEHLLKWKRNAQDRELIHTMIEDVVHEIKQVETMMNILEQHSYNYDCICEMSDYLCKMYK